MVSDDFAKMIATTRRKRERERPPQTLPYAREVHEEKRKKEGRSFLFGPVTLKGGSALTEHNVA